MFAYSTRPRAMHSSASVQLSRTFRTKRYGICGFSKRSCLHRIRVRRLQLSVSPCASLVDFVDVSHVVAAGSGFLLAAGAALILSQPDQTQRETQKAEILTLEEKIVQLENAVAEMTKQWEQDLQRVSVLEKARAAAVKDVTVALSQKRDVEFALSEAKTEIQRLQDQTSLPTEGSDVEAMMEQLPAELKAQLDSQGEETLKQWLTSLMKVIEAKSVDLRNELERLKEELRERKQRAIGAESEIQTVKDYAKAELQSMTSVLIQGRDEAQELKEEISSLKSEASQLRLGVAEAEAVIEDLQQRLSTAKDTETAQTNTPTTAYSNRYVHEMRAEAAHMVESIEDQAHAEVHKALQKSQSAQQRALRELIEATKAKNREEQLRAKLSAAQDRIKEQSVQVKYLTELLQILSSKEMQENAEEQTLNQQFPTEP